MKIYRYLKQGDNGDIASDCDLPNFEFQMIDSVNFANNLTISLFSEGNLKHPTLNRS